MPRRLLDCAAAALLCAPVAGTQSPLRELDFAEACAAAAKDGKVVLVDFCTTWSAPCKKLDASTWKDEKVKRWLGEKVVAAKIDAEKAFLLARRYGVRDYPTLLFVNSGGLELGRLSGFFEPEAFVASADDLLAKANAHKLARTTQAANPRDPTARMNLALSLSLQGRHAEALDQYLWCYEHGFANDEGFAGVRDTILLDEIERLGQAYAPAAPAIAELAHRSATQVFEGTAGEGDLRDYITLCARFSLQAEMLELFDRLKEKGGATAALRKILVADLLENLIEERRYTDIVANSPDMVQTLGDEFARYTNLKSQEGRTRPANSGDAAALEHLRAKALRTGGQFFEASLGVRDATLAHKIGDRILTFAPEAASYELLVRHALRAGATDAARAISKRADQTATLTAVEKHRIRRASMAPPSAH